MAARNISMQIKKSWMPAATDCWVYDVHLESCYRIRRG